MKMKKAIYIFLLIVIAVVVITCKKTPEIPSGNKIEIGETTIDSLLYYSAKVSTNVEAMKGNVISQHGHCWSTEHEPSIENGKTTLGKLTQPKIYTSELTNLLNNTTYYVRSYITYTYGAVYGSEQTIQTLTTGKPAVETTQVSDVTLYTAVLGGIVQADSGLAVTTRGICWDTDSIFTITNCIDTTVVGNGLGSFTSNITSLNEGAIYYATAYANNEKGTSYGEVKMFTTVPITTPIVNTTEITEITISTATSGGNVTSNGNGTVTARGICWNITGNPTLLNNIGYTSDGNGTGNFTSNITNLTDNTTYYISSYATNKKGTSYGGIQSFTTLELMLPEVETSTPTNITANSAQSGGNVTSEGNGTVATKGICWNDAGNPTLENCIGYTNNNSGIGNFTNSITGLTNNVEYYVIAYATNEKGTAYGQMKEFLAFNYYTDPRDGKVYKIVDIGDQTWFAENLNFQTGNSWCYNDNTSNCDLYGRLYDWSTAFDACPPGWHLPTDPEWRTLEGNADTQYPVGDPTWTGTGSRGYDAGKRLKSKVGWNSNSGTDIFGFTALPAGFLSATPSVGFATLGTETYWWSAGYGGGGAFYRNLRGGLDNVVRSSYDKEGGFSVRCLKD